MRGLGHIYKRGNIYWIKYHVNGEPRYESSESEIKQVAIDLLKKKFHNPGPRASGRVLVGELLDDLLTYYKTHNARSHDTMAVPCVKHLREFFGSGKAGKLSTVAINHYKEHRSDEDASNGSINRELSLLRRAYKLALESTPPKVASVPKFELLPESNPRTGFIEQDQYAALLAALPSDLKPVFIVGYHTGARKNEILKLKKSQVDW